MQSLYAFRGSESDDFTNEQKFLLNSIEDMYNLYLLLISLFIAIQKRAEQDLIKKKNKHLATQEDINPNRKFVNNTILLSLKNNIALNNQIKERKISHWDVDDEYVDVIFKAIISSDAYKLHMQTRESNFNEDKDFIEVVFKDIIAPNDKLYEYIEDKNLTWLDDLPLINTAILKLLRQVKLNSPDSYFIPKLYRDDEDKQFAIDLFKKTLLNTNTINKEIEGKIKNWDAERIADVDYVLLQMAISELQKFPSIPVKVTINEYLEIAKEYSTSKSSIFINGILDNLAKEYSDSGIYKKVGRGLV